MSFFEQPKTPFLALQRLWRADKDFIAKRKTEWKRISGVYDGVDRPRYLEVRKFFLTGEIGDLYFTPERWLLLAPWSSKNELLEMLHITDRLGKKDHLVSLLINNSRIKHDDRSGSERNHYFIGERDKVIQDMLAHASHDFEKGVEIDGVWFPFDFKGHVEFVERRLFYFLTEACATWYNGKTQMDYYQKAIEFYESNNIELVHSEKLNKLITLVYHYSPVQELDSNRVLANDLVASYRSWLDSDLCPRVSLRSRDEARNNRLVEFRRDANPDQLRKDGTTYFKTDQGYPPFFLFDKKISSILEPLKKAITDSGVCKSVAFDFKGIVDLAGELPAKFLSAAGLVDKSIAPAIYIRIAPELTFKGECEGDGLSVWIDLYVFISPKIKDTSIGRVTAYVLPRLSSHFEEYYVNLPLVQFRHSIRASLSRVVGRDVGIPMPCKKYSPGQIDFKYPSLLEGHYPSRIQWNIQGAKTKNINLPEGEMYREIVQCLKSLA